MTQKYSFIKKFILLHVLMVYLLIFLVIRFSTKNDVWNLLMNYSDEEKQIREYESKIIPGLGADGKAAFLEGEDKILGDLALKSFAINTVLSDRIPLDRSLRDFRHYTCKRKVYDVHRNVSVVIIFYEESFSVLLRTVWSIINRTPSNLLHEIILVDDYSKKNVCLGKQLDHYLETRLKNYPVKLIRTKKRTGIVRARLTGARAATGDILVFLDAHCECTSHWLEPLIDRIEYDRTIVTIPAIDLIAPDTFEYSTSDDLFQVGGFSWSGYFIWIEIQESEVKRRKLVSDPVRSPTMAGGLFAIERAYFWESGSYDEQMDGWGGENLELSFRIWQCGGKIEQIPCSQVGHIFSEFHPNRLDSGITHAINMARLAKVWMDEYADLYFLHQNKYKNSDAIGDLTHRKELRKKLNCKPFSWYLENVYPEKFIPNKNVKDYGQLKTFGNLCLDNLLMDEDSTGPLGLYPCHIKTYPSQFFSLSRTNELRQEEHCAEVLSKDTVQQIKCHGKRGMQEWIMDSNGLVENLRTGLCLSSEGVHTSPLVVRPCDKDNEYQQWKFVRNF